jgi:hypothetical protein
LPAADGATTANPASADGRHNHRIQTVNNLRGNSVFTADPDAILAVFAGPIGLIVGGIANMVPAYFNSSGGASPYIETSGHSHNVRVSFTTPSSGPTPTGGNGTEQHTHSVPDTVFAGVTDVAVRNGAPQQAHTHLEEMTVTLDGQDITTYITDRMPDAWRLFNNGQKRLGNGSSGHPLNDREGTGPIDLLAIAAQVGVDLGAPQTHRLEFSVAKGGGKVLYNLYVA